MVWPSIILLGIIVGGLLILIFALWSGLVDKLTNAVLALIRTGGAAPALFILQREGDYAVVRLRVGEGAHLAGRSVKDAGFAQRDIIILALTQGKRVLSLPTMNERLRSGDQLLCYGKMSAIKALMK
jgi:uncharacterized protein with PhoU and TrkA domain